MDDLAGNWLSSENSFPADHPFYEVLRTISQHVAEEEAKFDSDHVRALPNESEDWKAFADWKVKGIVGRLDVRANWLCIFSVWDEKTVGLYWQTLQAVIAEKLQATGRLSPPGVQTDYLISELRIRLTERLHHWKAQALRFAREGQPARELEIEPNTSSQPEGRALSQRLIDLIRRVADAANKQPHAADKLSDRNSNLSVPDISVPAVPIDPTVAIDPDISSTKPTAGSSPRRRNRGFGVIDSALREIAKSLPKSHEEVFRQLDGRVDVPFANPFRSAKGWHTGFKKNRPLARAWLSHRWAGLNLPPFPRGPKSITGE
ncbi:MAG: hypothetical protein ABI759_03055 [Candidatus Solibacter sp.]